MDVRTISDRGTVRHTAEELPALLADPEQLVWVDMSLCTPADATVLADVFDFHDLALRDCVERNHVAKVHLYADHAFTVVHAPELGTGGHVHYVELDQFVGPNYLVTIHGPLNPAVPMEVALTDTRAVVRRIDEGHIRPRTPMALSAAILGALIRRETDLIADLAEQSGRLEKEVTDDIPDDDPEALLQKLYEVRQELLAIGTMAAHAGATYGRMGRLAGWLPEHDRALPADLADRFELVRSIADDQRAFISGAIEFFQTRTSTHMTIAAEQLAAVAVRQNDDTRRITAWVAIIAVPTAITGFFGQNVPYPGFAKSSGFVVSSVLIVLVAVVLYLTFRWKKWL